MLKNNISFYQDEYTHFTFNGISSAYYNLMIINNLDDLKMIVDSEYSLQFLQPKNQNGQYLLGVSGPQKSFPFSLVAHGVNRQELRQIIQWLKVGTTGTLSFDYAPDWEYDVVIRSVDNPQLYAQEDDHFIATFKINFVTLEEPVAHSKFKDHISIQTTTKTENVDYGSNVYADTLPMNGSSVSSTPVNLQYQIPGCIAIKKESGIQLRICFLGNQKATIDFKASNDSYNNNTEFAISLTDDNIIHPQFNKACLVLASEVFMPNDYFVEYNNRANVFLINGQLAETLVLNKELKGPDGTDDPYSYFIHNTHSFTIESPGEPLCINNKTAAEIEQLLATHESWFIYRLWQPYSQNLEYYVPTSAEAAETDGDFKWMADTSGAPTGEEVVEYMASCAPEDKFYFGYYKDLLLINKNFNYIDVYVRQYNYVL